MTPAEAVDVCDVQWENRRYKFQSALAGLEAQINVFEDRRRKAEITPDELKAAVPPLESKRRKVEAQYKREEKAYETLRATAAEAAAK